MLEPASLPGFVAGLERLGARPAFIDRSAFRSSATSYAELGLGARRIAAGIRAAGLGPGDRVVLCGEASARWAAAFYACVLTGSVAVPVDARSSPELAEELARRSGAKLRLALGARPGPGWLAPEELPGAASGHGLERPHEPGSEDELLEIVYTSGTTARPKGVAITHGNLLANLRPIAAELARHRLGLRLLGPLVFAHLIPLSHLFGQVLALFVPQLAGGSVVFETSSPERVARSARACGARVIVAVPQQLEALGRHVCARAGIDPDEVLAGAAPSLPGRWLRYRRVHAQLGFRLWAFVVGGATLPAATEALWSRLGFAVIQGYGLTETAPAVTVSHPLRLRRGSVGRRLPGVELRIAPDGEVLVRGPNVTRGYVDDDLATRALFEDGWLRTGDLGRLDAEGNLVILGRKKDVIVTADGRNVYPDDVEAVLALDPRVREAAVVGPEAQGRPRVHAVLALADGVAPEAAAAIAARANERLESHQRIHSTSLWPAALPRTATGKLKRAELRAAVEKEAVPAPGELSGAIERLLAGRKATPETRLVEDLGLSSLDRLELAIALEQEARVGLDEQAVSQARTVGELERLVRSGPARAPAEAGLEPRPGPSRRRFSYPRWPSGAAARLARALLLDLAVFPLMRLFVKLEVKGLERLDGLEPPLVIAPNHQSIIDYPPLLRALPRRLRSRTAPAATPGHFLAAIEPDLAWPWHRRLRDRLKLFLVRLGFNAFLIPDGPGLKDALAHMGWCADRGLSLVVYPEGERTPDGRLGRLRPGVGVIAHELGLTVVPVAVTGLYEILPRHAWWPRRGRARVAFEPAIDTRGLAAERVVAELAARLEQGLASARTAAP